MNLVNKTSDQIIDQMVEPAVAKARDFSSAVIPITPERIYAELEQQAESIGEEIEDAANLAGNGLRNEITTIGRQLASIEVASYTDFRAGKPLIASVDPTSTAQNDQLMINGVSNKHNCLTAIVKGAPQETFMANLALAIGFILIALSSFLVYHSTRTGVYGNDPVEMNFAQIALMFGAIAIAVAEAVICFLNGVYASSRMTKTMVIAAFLFLGLRYVALSFHADPDAQDSLPWKILRDSVYWFESIGMGIATTLVGIAAGLCFTTFWRNLDRAKFLPLAMSVLEDIAKWHHLRAAFPSTVKVATVTKDDVIKRGIALIANGIDEGLTKWHSIVSRKKTMTTTAPTGSADDAHDIGQLVTSLASCEAARDQLLALAGLMPAKNLSSTVSSTATF